MGGRLAATAETPSEPLTAVRGVGVARPGDAGLPRRTHLLRILALLALEKFSSCRDSWVRKATAKWK